MNGKKIKNLPMQVFYTSKEETNCPLIADLYRIIKILKTREKIKETSDVTISFTYAKRMLINSFIQELSNIKKEELLEIVDYDPIKNNLLVMGKADPKIETTLHFMIHHARNDVNIIVQINNQKICDNLKEKIPIIEKNYPINSIDFMKLVLKTLRDNRIVGIKKTGILFVGKNLDEIKKHIEEIL